MTAELAVALPALLVLAGALLYGVLAASAQLRCVDAAREGARAMARGDTREAALAVARAAAPAGAEVAVSRSGTLVRVAVSARPAGGFLVSAAAETTAEDAGP
ncbi:TadE family type IV pilus minor pilin [Phaeacidiphilus oryzae]|uniref:TadE family type IV pilus minor pilin n=1 Tax=Phaeacidiphilus oryzae TaxID=348818 RepID=UPI000566B9BB|nr:TadE family type IV pilus minor pilin [Phaeacidiphilus oryzae]